MSDWIRLGVGLVMALNLLALGSSRIPSLIRAASWQGVVLGLLPLFLEHEHLHGPIVGVALATVAVKGFFIPGLLRRALRSAHIHREIEPHIGTLPSLLLGSAGTLAALPLAEALPLLPEHCGLLLLPGALACLLTGFLLLIGRRKAISQVCGYLILENGVYLFGLLLLRVNPLLVETGILLDLTVGIFVLGIILDRIQRTFDSLDTRHLTTLRE